MCDSEFLMFVYFLVVYCLGGKFCGKMTKPLFFENKLWEGENCIETNKLERSLREINYFWKVTLGKSV